MLFLPYMICQSQMRRSLVGALATDPVIPERRRAPRRPILARLAPARPRVARAPATARSSS